MNYNLTKPCDQCPFRNDQLFILSRGRVTEIIETGMFPCHKTTETGGADGKNEEACAGLMILMEKENQPDQMMRIAERVGLYDRTKLDMRSPVYESFDEAVFNMEE